MDPLTVHTLARLLFDSWAQGAPVVVEVDGTLHHLYAGMGEFSNHYELHLGEEYTP